MKRADLEHIIRAAAEIANDSDIVVKGSALPGGCRAGGLVERETLLSRLAEAPVSEEVRERAEARVKRAFGSAPA